jgi:antitoxin component YwqK of YwqJK toxin-antitoxin module
LKRIIHFSNGKPTGKYYTYYENGHLRNETTYNSGKLHGVNRVYNKKGLKLRESLYIDNKQKIFKKYSVNTEKQTKMQCYAVNNGKAVEIGQIVYDKDDDILLSHSFYYNIIGPDTITYGQNYNFKIKVLIGNCIDSCNMKLKLGELNSNFKFKNKNDILTFESKNSNLKARLKNPQSGYNLITGILYIKNNSENIANFVVYKEYYVKK